MNLAADLKCAVLALQPRPTIAVAESLTGGRVQARITEVPGASEYFRGGMTAYALDRKVELLGVDREEVSAANGVSERIAGAMALGACRLFGADWAVSTTGYAEPSPAAGVTTPFAWVAVAGGDGGNLRIQATRRIECPGASRTEVQNRVADAAVELLVATLRAPRT